MKPTSRVRALAALGALAITAGVAGGCTNEEGPPENSPATSGGATTGGSTALPGGATTSTGGSAVSNGGGGASSSSGGMATSLGGTPGGGTPSAGGTSGAGGSVAPGGNSSGGEAVSAGGTAGMSGGGAAGQGEWWFNGPRPAPTLGSWPPPAIKLTEVAAGTQPTAIAAPRGDTTRLFFTEKWGRIRVIKDGMLVAEPALDMRTAVLEGGPQGSSGAELMNQGKRGLVGLAFHPNYEENGRVFVMYTADQGIAGYGTTNHTNLYDDGDMTFAEYRRSASNPDKFDPEPVKVFLQFDKGNCDQCSQHNGGSLEVDVDGFLWASTGDPPPYNNPGAQDLMNLNGKLLRFDISGAEVKGAGNYPGADPYVASVGIRNAYKFSVDRYTGDIYVGDVGENSWEEITVEKYGQRNMNHEWPGKEGNQEYMDQPCTQANCLAPVYEYGHTGMEGAPGADNCIIGGYVYRGKAIPALQGAYIYGDYGSGKVRAVQVQGGKMVMGPHQFPGLSVFMGCFGEDAAGEMYVCDYNNDKILRVDAQ
jgi:glucose/arabinose dehydrogenase